MKRKIITSTTVKGHPVSSSVETGNFPGTRSGLCS